MFIEGIAFEVEDALIETILLKLSTPLPVLIPTLVPLILNLVFGVFKLF